MASKKKNPSFDIPDAVRRAGQSGWVYRTKPSKGHPLRTAAARRASTTAPARATAPREPATPPPASVVAEEPQTMTPAEPAPERWNVSTGVVGLGLHVAAVPLMVPLYVTAAISRKLGLLPR